MRGIITMFLLLHMPNDVRRRAILGDTEYERRQKIRSEFLFAKWKEGNER